MGKPWLGLDPVDLTSLLGSGIRAAVSSPSYHGLPHRSVLETIAGALSLVEYASGVPIPIVTEIQEASGTETTSDYVEATPSIPLASENWYELRLSSVPPEVRLAYSGMRAQPGGGVSARFTTGSHPTLQSIHMCQKSDIEFSVEVEFSEYVSQTESLALQVRLDPTEPSNVCPLNKPVISGGAIRGVLFNCQLGAGTSRQMRLTVAGSLGAPTGASFEASPGVQGDYVLLIDESMWERYEPGCGNIVLP